jgi:hypothetical protein
LYQCISSSICLFGGNVGMGFYTFLCSFNRGWLRCVESGPGTRGASRARPGAQFGRQPGPAPGATGPGCSGCERSRDGDRCPRSRTAIKSAPGAGRKRQFMGRLLEVSVDADARIDVGHAAIGKGRIGRRVVRDNDRLAADPTHLLRNAREGSSLAFRPAS